jgi:16S rRNA (cytosine1402-N4)-methyltransferase
MENPVRHIPVMLSEMLEYLAPRAGGVYIDGTFGAGGYSRAILDAADCRVVAFDRDETVAPVAAEMEGRYLGRFCFFHNRFSEIRDVMRVESIAPADGLVLDLGVSSMQIGDAARGFSFRSDGPLSMSMGKNGATAFDVVNGAPEAELADIIYKYGEERRSRAIAGNIVKARMAEPVATTLRLAGIVGDAVGPRAAATALPRVFQALRIFVNDELGELSQVLADSPYILASRARLVVVGFHSLEDRIVKDFIRANTAPRRAHNKYAAYARAAGKAAIPKMSFKTVVKNAIIPSVKELEDNPRARSAKLRVAERV